MGQGESGEHDPGLNEEYAGDAALEAARGRGGAALEAALDEGEAAPADDAVEAALDDQDEGEAAPADDAVEAARGRGRGRGRGLRRGRPHADGRPAQDPPRGRGRPRSRTARNLKLGGQNDLEEAKQLLQDLGPSGRTVPHCHRWLFVSDDIALSLCKYAS